MEWDWEDSKYLSKETTGSYIYQLLSGYALENKCSAYRDIDVTESINTLPKPRIHQIIDYHILLGMLDVNYKGITREILR